MWLSKKREYLFIREYYKVPNVARTKDNSKFNSRRNDRKLDREEVEESLQTSFALYGSGNYIKHAQHSISSLRKKYSRE